MTDPRIKRVAEILVNYSLRIKKGEYVGISAQTSAAPLIKELYEIILKKGAYPVGDFTIPGLAYTYFKNASDEQLSKTPEISKYAAEKCHASVSIGADTNTKELSTINPDRISIRSKAIKPIKDIILKKDRWVLFKYPTDALAQDAEMSLQEFEDFVYTACIKDWEKETKKLLPLKQAMDRGSTVRIKGEDTDISFSIKARTAVIGDGKHNIPDGEVFTAPVEKTVNGRIKFTFPAIRDSREVSGVYLEFR
ncbi:MAG: aminopeptidase, partial [Nanoarchaeota archaeon]|nr:aminopeptidase [Nanoarchaeota archaeon]